ncbi:MAG: DNA cytosine methyltransferase [Thaumarchaeota archaeon]|nr:DNA cytosine methyltransferase [Nitrososphaerota archaeon]
MRTRRINYIDLFCGVGGMSRGFENEGFENIFSIDYDETTCKTYRENFPKNILLEKDIKNLTEKKILNLTDGKEIDVIIGGTPCQGFSMAGNIGRTFIDDPRNYLFKEFAKVTSILKPKFFVIENVARLYNHNGGKTRDEIISLFKNLGYEVDCKILNAVDFGVAQIRRRIFIIGNRLGLQVKFPEKIVNIYRTVEEEIGMLPKLSSGETSEISNHVAMRHSEQMLHKMSYVSNGGSRKQIPKRVRPKSGDQRKYIRYDKDKPSVCITGDMRKVFHYSQNRALTVRELARLQSFSDNFVFLGSTISKQQQVGNAVPPLMAQAVARTIKQQLTITIKNERRE